MADHILVVEDDQLLRRTIRFNLEQSGYRVTSASNAEDGLEILSREHPDLILLDIGLPGQDGLQALQEIRRVSHVPVIFLTARRRELDEALGLEMGADDYITKPFDLPVLLSRIKALLRRVNDFGSDRAQKESLEEGDLAIDPIRIEATLKGRRLELPPREFDLLYYLMSRAGEVVSVDRIIQQVWGAEYEGQSQVVYVHIRWLREKIEADPKHPVRIVTVRGRGYQFIPQTGS